MALADPEVLDVFPFPPGVGRQVGDHVHHRKGAAQPARPMPNQLVTCLEECFTFAMEVIVYLKILVVIKTSTQKQPQMKQNTSTCQDISLENYPNS